MAVYVCNKCNYTTTYKQNILKHLNKKNPCLNQIIYLSKEECLELKKNSKNISNENDIFEN